MFPIIVESELLCRNVLFAKGVDMFCTKGLISNPQTK